MIAAKNCHLFYEVYFASYIYEYFLTFVAFSSQNLRFFASLQFKTAQKVLHIKFVKKKQLVYRKVSV